MKIDHTTDGIPSSLTIDFARDWVRTRVTEKRFRHITGVAKVAREIAERAGVDIDAAELASWLHDACKELKDTELVRQAKEFGMKLSTDEEKNGHLLHGPIAAFTVKKEFGLTNQAVLDAISEHTLGAVNMTDLSKVVFLADCLEESRPKEYTDPIWKALNISSKEGPDLDTAVLKACELNLAQLNESGRFIHPRTVDVHNFYLKAAKK